MPPPWPPSVQFYLDECFPEQTAQALSLVHYPITWPRAENQTGALDPDLIPWMAERRYVWITRDAAARRAHGALIRRSGLSVLWIRGVGRNSRTAEHNVSMHDVHLMLTTKLLEFADKLAAARNPRHAMIHMNGGRPKLDRVDLEQIAEDQALKVVGRW